MDLQLALGTTEIPLDEAEEQLKALLGDTEGKLKQQYEVGSRLKMSMVV